jgi:hypothetical protein
VGTEPSPAVVVRRRICWALIAALSSVLLALSAGVGSPLSVDTWAFIILAVPALAVTVVALVIGAPVAPSSVLFARRDERGTSKKLWRWFVMPYAVPLLTPVCLVVSQYIGAALSAQRTPPQGLGPLLFASTDLGWYLPLVGLLFGGLLGWVGIMSVAVPVKALTRVPRLWKSDRTEALRLTAHVGVVVGLWLTMCAQGVFFLDDSEEDTSRLSVLRDELELLLGRSQTDIAPWARLFAWAGVLCIAAAGAIVWKTSRATKE